MNSSLRFDPIFPAHAIERCSATIVFDQPLPQKIWSSVRTRHRDRLLGAGLLAGPPTVGMQIDISTGRIVPIEGDGPGSYVTSNRAETLTLASNQINLTTTLYTRWLNFEATLNKLFIPLVADYSAVVSISAIQLEYNDRFIWSGTWDNFSSDSLLHHQGGLFAARPAKAGQWHCHSGWVETPEPGKRRLINVNIDTGSTAVPNSGVPGPSIGIRTVIQDGIILLSSQTASNWYNESDVVPILRQEHTDLKDLLRQIISSAMAEKIGL
jgi:uncharacterized protein (TIGR04255 family)